MNSLSTTTITRKISLSRREHERKLPRLIKALNVQIRAWNESEPRICQLFVLDISEGGIRVKTHEKWSLEARLFLTIPLKSFGKMLPKHITVECEVRWRKSLHGAHHIHGLMFVNQDQEQKTTLRNLIEGLSQFGGRLHKRVEILMPVEMQLENEKMSIVVIRNLSLGGVGFRSKRALKETYTIKFRLPMPNGEWVVGALKIAWATELKGGVFEYGAAFHETTPNDRELIEALIEHETRT